MSSNRNAWLCGFAAYILWGSLPLFWKTLSHVSPSVVVAHRVIWSTVCLATAVWWFRSSWKGGAELRSQLIWYASSAVLLSLNWGVYIWAVSYGYVLASSLGYFIAPLLYVAVGALVLRERLSRFQKTGLALGSLAMFTLLLGSDMVTTIVAVLLSTSIVAYGFLRKKGSLGSFEGLFLESLVLTGPAIGYLLWLNGAVVFASEVNLSTIAILVAAGPVTLFPLLLFSVAVRRLPLTSIGFLQYVSPILQFLIAVAVLHETVSTERLIAFSLVWFGILVVVYGEFSARRTRRAQALVATTT